MLPNTSFARFFLGFDKLCGVLKKDSYCKWLEFINQKCLKITKTMLVSFLFGLYIA